jgi:hypothetical protein
MNNPSLEQLEKLLGGANEAAVALGYSERRYRDFKSGKVSIPKAVELAIDRLLDVHKIPSTTPNLT